MSSLVRKKTENKDNKFKNFDESDDDSDEEKKVKDPTSSGPDSPSEQRSELISFLQEVIKTAVAKELQTPSDDE